jgi:hypothetical protein
MFLRKRGNKDGAAARLPGQDPGHPTADFCMNTSERFYELPLTRKELEILRVSMMKCRDSLGSFIDHNEEIYPFLEDEAEGCWQAASEILLKVDQIMGGESFQEESGKGHDDP